MKLLKNKWYDFKSSVGSRQARPKIYKHVLVKRKSLDSAFPDPICVGYRKDAAGDKQCPYFVTPGMNGKFGDVYSWNDCLPDDFQWPKVEKVK